MRRRVSRHHGLVTAGGAVLAILVAAGLAPSLARSQPASAKPSFQCYKGPLRRTFAGGPWLVYACDDGKSLVVVTEKGNAAFPFYFLLWPVNGAYHVEGEGAGSKRASDAAGDELSHLSPSQIEALVSAAGNLPSTK